MVKKLIIIILKIGICAGVIIILNILLLCRVLSSSKSDTLH